MSGGITGLSFEEANAYRVAWKNFLENIECDYKIKCFNPMEYYNFNMPSDTYTEKEIFTFELKKLRKCDLVLVNQSNPNSIGTAMEIMLAMELNIPILLYIPKDIEAHPWIIECGDKIFNDEDKLLDYVKNKYLS